MKKILGLIALVIGITGHSYAYTEIDASREAAFSSAVTVSTTPAIFTSSTNLVNIEEIRVWNYTTDVIYINYTLPASSTTAAASGVKVFQSDKNDGFISILVNRFVNIWFTLAADSGTSSLRIEEFGRAP